MTRLRLALAVWFIGAAAAQQPMIRLNVAAFDGRGQPVSDLGRADLQIQDAGREQALAFFHVSHPGPGAISHATLVLFDLLNADMTNRTFSTDEIVHSLQGRETSDFLYLYLLTPDIKLQPVHALPNSPADLKAGDPPWTRNIRTLLDDALKNANRLRQGGLVEDDRVRRTYEALTTVVSTLALIPGHKNVVWVSRGIPIALRVVSGGDEINYRPLLRKFADACERAGVSIIPVNPSTSAVPSESELSSVETLQQLANLTGGRLYTANSIGKAVTQAADAWRGTYTLAYLPAADNWDGKLHKLKVSAARRGLDLLYRDAYYADRLDATERVRAALQLAVSSPFDFPEMRLEVTAVKGKALEIRVNPEDVFLAAKDGRFTANLALAIVDYTAKGPKSISPPAAMNVSMSQQQHDAALLSGILLTQDHPAAEGVERLRVIVYDQATGLAGSRTIGLK